MDIEVPTVWVKDTTRHDGIRLLYTTSFGGRLRHVALSEVSYLHVGIYSPKKPGWVSAFTPADANGTAHQGSSSSSTLGSRCLSPTPPRKTMGRAVVSVMFPVSLCTGVKLITSV